MMAVGYEDDSFITYHFEVKENGQAIDIVPIMRGIGHRNFVQCIKFDKFFQINHLQYLQQQFDSELTEDANLKENIEEEKQ